MSKKEIPEELREKLDNFEIEVPEIPMKKSKIDRFANWIYAPARDPLELFSIKGNSITRLAFSPLLVVIILCLAPMFLI